MPHPVPPRLRRQADQWGVGIALAGAVGGTPVAAGWELPGGCADEAQKTRMAMMTSSMTRRTIPPPPPGIHGGLDAIYAPSLASTRTPRARKRLRGGRFS